MAPTPLLLLQLLLVSLASASHNKGGSATFTYKGRNSDGTFKVEHYTKDTFTDCFGPFYSHNWNCYRGNCGRVEKTVEGAIDNGTSPASGTRKWCETSTIITRNVPSDKPFSLRAGSCCWVRTRNSVSSWVLLTTVDLGTRSDTNKPNRAPDIGILPFIRVPTNCPRTYEVMAFDPDGDHVRCRYGKSRNIECSTCHPPSGFVINQDSCTIKYNFAGSSSTSVFAFEMVVEDFPQQDITLRYTDGSRSHKNALNQTHNASFPLRSPATRTLSPLSKLPLQFSVLVETAVPSCQEGQYIPQLLPPTPYNKAVLKAEVNRQIQIKVKARATLSVLSDVIMTGPLKIRSSRSSFNEFVISWTPTENEKGQHFPICFAVESMRGSAVYQSEMRCVLVEVEKQQDATHVTCTETAMIVTVEKSSVSRLHEDHLRLNDASNTACRLKSNNTHIIGVIPLNSCGTQIDEDSQNLYFRNEITTVDNLTDVITRKHLLEVEFYCQYAKRKNMTLAFRIHRDNVTVMERGFGTFTFGFEFYSSNQFRSMMDPNLYPLEYEIGSRIFMQIEATTTVSNTELFVESCSAAPYDIPNYVPTYPIIENGCTVDSSVIVHPRGHIRQFRFSMEAFKFIGLHDQVYISCQVMMCVAGDPNTRCSQGCQKSKSGRGKREAVSQGTMHFISQGPLRLRRSAEGTEVSAMNTNLNLNLVFIAGCLLAAVAMIGAVVVFKAKMSRIRYQPLATNEG